MLLGDNIWGSWKNTGDSGPPSNIHWQVWEERKWVVSGDASVCPSPVSIARWEEVPSILLLYSLLMIQLVTILLLPPMEPSLCQGEKTRSSKNRHVFCASQRAKNSRPGLEPRAPDSKPTCITIAYHPRGSVFPYSFMWYPQKNNLWVKCSKNFPWTFLLRILWCLKLKVTFCCLLWY